MPQIIAFLDIEKKERENGLKDFIKYRLPAVLWMLFIYCLSSIPGNNLPDVDFPLIHLIVHFIEYSVLGFLLVRSFAHSVGKEKFFFVATTAFVVALLFAASDEWHQSFVPGRNGQVITVVYDAIFAMLGIGSFLLMLKVRKK